MNKTANDIAKEIVINNNPIGEGNFTQFVFENLVDEIEQALITYATQVKEILPTPDSSTGNNRFTTLSEVMKVIDEWIKSNDVFITNGKGGEVLHNAWIDCTKGSLLKRLTPINNLIGEPKSKPDSSTGMRTAEEIIQDMIAEMPFVLATNNIPYIVEAMHIFKNQSITPKEGEGWIDVKDRLPEIGEFVLVYNTEGAILTGRLMQNDWCANFIDGEELMGELTATHWQPLPTPPSNR